MGRNELSRPILPSRFSKPYFRNQEGSKKKRYEFRVLIQIRNIRRNPGNWVGTRLISPWREEFKGVERMR